MDKWINYGQMAIKLQLWKYSTIRCTIVFATPHEKLPKCMVSTIKIIHCNGLKDYDGTSVMTRLRVRIMNSLLSCISATIRYII